MVVLDALKFCHEWNECHPDRIWHFARICRVWNVMQPHVEAVRARAPLKNQRSGIRFGSGYGSGESDEELLAL